jgi:hypothetical protein
MRFAAGADGANIGYVFPLGGALNISFAYKRDFTDHWR